MNNPLKSQTRHLREGFTLIELLVVVAIIVVLISVLLPSLNNARQQAKGVKCMSNERQIGMAIQMYSYEYNGLIPIVKNSVDPTITQAQRDSWKASWWINPWMVRLYPYLNITAPAGSTPTEAHRRAWFTGPFMCPGKNDFDINASSDIQRESYALNSYNSNEDPTKFRYYKLNDVDMRTALLSDDHSTGALYLTANKYLYNQEYRALGWYHAYGHNMLFPGGDVQKIRELGVDWNFKLVR